MNYNETLDYIHSLNRYASKEHRTNLERMSRLCALLGNPQESVRAVHIAGTNGKGSISAYCAEVLTHSGYKTGRFISPFIEDFRERISIDGIDISEEELISCTAEAAEHLPTLISEGLGYPVEFEFVTAIGFLYFKRMGCDFMVVETGIGGRLDCTNVLIRPEVCVIGVIGYDHTSILGDTLAQIASEKSGIIKSSGVVVSYPLQPEGVDEVISSRAAEVGSAHIVPDAGAIESVKATAFETSFAYRGENYQIKLPGTHQVNNAICAIEALRALSVRCGEAIEYKTIASGLAAARFPARLEVLSRDPLTILDGAHNTSGVGVLCDYIEAHLKNKKLRVIFGCVSDKNPSALLKCFFERVSPASVGVYSIHSPRACTGEEMLGYVREYTQAQSAVVPGLEVYLREIAPDIGSDEVILCFGSLYLAGEFKAACRKVFFTGYNITK